MPFQYSAYAQCVIKSTIVKVNSSTPIDQTHCKVNFDFIFTLERNSGNKYIYIHAWMAGQYPNNFCRTTDPLTKAPMASDLLNSVVNIGIHNEPHAQHHIPYLLDSYLPDPTVPLTITDITNPNALERFVYPTGDSAMFTIKGVETIVPLACSSVISLNVDFWSSQADNGSVLHCYTCNTGITIDPRVSGIINCSSPTSINRTFNLQINTLAPTPISGNYSVYLDNMTSLGVLGTFGPEDVLIFSNPYATTISGGINGFFANNVGYPPYNATKPDADKNLWVLVQTNGYTNQALGFLANNCAPLPIQLRSFEIKKVNQAVVLNWETLMELNCKGFDVQRKLGNESFSTIGFIPAIAMEGTGYDYQFTDENLKAGAVAFYRLKLVDKDNGVAYSEIKSVRNGASKMLISINPNPGNGYVNVQLASDAGTYNAVLFDYTGKVVKNFGFMQKEVFSINNMKPGMYVLKIYFKDSGEQIAERIIVQ